MGEAENELRDAPRRIARERVPTIAVGRDLHGFPYVEASGAASLDEVDDALQTPTRRLADTPTRFPWRPYPGRQRLEPSLTRRRAFVAPVIQVDFNLGSSTRLRLFPTLRGRLANAEPQRHKAPASVAYR
jgi:hypothetical protein